MVIMGRLTFLSVTNLIFYLTLSVSHHSLMVAPSPFYRLVITSLSLCREMRPPDSTNCVFSSFHSFFHFTKSSPKHPLHRGKALCHVLGIRQRPRTHLPVPPGAHRLAPKEFITCLSHTRGNEHWHFVAGKSLRDLFILGLILTTATFY